MIKTERMQRKWVLKNPCLSGRQEGNPPKAKIEHLKNTLNIDDTIANLLVQRGITNYEEAKKFFRPDLANLYDPFLMKDMDKAVDRIEKAIKNKEKILIYGDYDVDGTTGVALVYSFLNNIYPDSSELFGIYIPDRYTEGYGVSMKSIDYAKENKFSLIIAIDCGIKANEQIEYAKKKSIDFIVCDHHEPGEKLPKAVAILDPKRQDCDYPYKELSGCGIGFKLAQAYATRQQADGKTVPIDIGIDVEKYLDLVAISVASDIVPINGENRIFAYYGLKLINANPRVGVKAIIDTAGLRKEIKVDNIVFGIGPRINAAGRIHHGKKVVELLVTKDPDVAIEIANSINSDNIIRRDLDSKITEEALKMVEEEEEGGKDLGFGIKDLGIKKQRVSTVLYSPDWHKGVIGIVASRLIDYYYRPTIIFTESNPSNPDGILTGSARTIRDLDIYKVIEKCGDLLEQFGGHKFAAGLTIKKENLPAFKEKFNETVNETIKNHEQGEEIFSPKLEIDAEINFSDITPKFCRILRQFAPFGPSNMKPVFKTSKVLDKGYGQIVGENHLKLNVYQTGEDLSAEQAGKMESRVFSAIAFHQKHRIYDISDRIPFSICYSIEENKWKGMDLVEFNIRDILIEN